MLARLVVIIFCICVTRIDGQTLSEVNLKYGKPTNAYSVSPHISMTPDFAPDGQVCQMRLYPKHINRETSYLSPQLYFEELNGVLNQLVPFDSRGGKKESFGLTDFGGGAAWTTYEYERVTFIFIFTFAFKIDPGVKRETEPMSLPEAEIPVRPQKTTPSIDDFAPSQSTKTEIVKILWNGRKCAGRH